MYELLILGRLAQMPMHGYRIAKIIGHIFGPVRQVQWGALYPVLNRLEQEGSIEAQESVEAGDARARKVYSITPKGRERLHELLLDTEHHQGEYPIVFAHKVTLFHLLAPDEQRRLCRHYLVYAQRHIDHFSRRCRELPGEENGMTPQHRADVMRVMEHAVEHWEHERTWAENLIARIPLEEAG